MPITPELLTVRTSDPDTNEMWHRVYAGELLIAYVDVVELSEELWIEELAVHPAYRGAGQATTLLRAVLDERPDAQFALSCGGFKPSVREWLPTPSAGLPDTALAAWYGRHGFRPDPGSGKNCRMVRLP
ncbi:GNAT family N-acetyltransferase [Streptomyces anulatus]|uniref:GNAT family N-acetyltransferase n=1 Tax=Streptomyces anulatus TaxID=1892 RepID=UPI00364BCE38